jgi:(Z)-2-((N-methylformamido)methylene)-5-hydroxybutyrolactone dehydrogenase
MGRPETLTRYQLHIGGRWVEPAGKGYFPSYNPFTQEPWAEIPQAGPEDVKAAVAAARDTFDRVWSKTSGIDRAKLMLRLADIMEEEGPRMGRLESTDNGKVVRETSSQMLFLARVLRFYAGYADKIWGKVMPLDRKVAGGARRRQLRGGEAVGARLCDDARIREARREGRLPGGRVQRGHGRWRDR